MERIEHLLENNVNNFGSQQSEKDDSFCHSTSLNKTGVTNETKVAEESEGKCEQRIDNVFLEKDREVSSISITSGDSKNCLSAIAEMYSSSDEETGPENSTESPNNESNMAEEAGCKEMGINNFLKIDVDPISVQDRGASLEEENNNLNSNNSTDAALQITTMVEPELSKNPESGGGTLVESDTDEQIHTLVKSKNDGSPAVEPINDGSEQREPESDKQILAKTGNDRHTLIESRSDGNPAVEPTCINDRSKQIEPESNGQILLEPKIDGDIFMETGSDRCTVMETESVGHTPTEATTDKSMPTKPESSECTLFGSRNDEHIILEQPGSNGHTHTERTLKEEESDRCILSESKSNWQMEDNNDGHIVKIDSGGHTLIEPINDGDTTTSSKSDGHTPMETDNEGNILIKSDSGGHMLMNAEYNKLTLTEQRNDEHTLTEPGGKMRTFIEPKSEEGSLVGLDRHGGTTICSVTSHQVYAMGSIDKEIQMISESEHASQMLIQTECDTKDSSSSSDSSSDDESSSSESESSESSSESDLEDIRKEIEKVEEHIQTGPLKTKSELSVKDLPEVPDLDITIDENVQLVVLGAVFSIVESLVVVKALPQTPALDSDSVLFLENRSCLGLVFETFGPVQTPFYSVRFNVDRDINDKDVHVGDKVFYAPDMMEFSNFVFVTQLKKLKGSDASWEHDEEPPQEVIEYSDDEEESRAKASKKKERMARKGPCADDIKKESGIKNQPGPIRGGRKRTWQSRGRGQPVNQNQGVLTSNAPPLQHPAYRFPVPQPGDSLPSQATPRAVQRPAIPPPSPFMSHPTQCSPPFGMRHMVPLRGLPPTGPLGMMPQTLGPFPGPHPGLIGNVPIPLSSPSRPLIGAQHVPGHWPVGPPPVFAPRYPMPGPRETNIGFGLPTPPPPPHPTPPPPPPPNR